LQEEDIPGRTKIRELVIREWKRYFLQLKSDLSKAVGDISFTADGWSDKNLQNFLAIMAHWVHRKPDG
ncbi:hypothetical protein BDN72DRAFT_734107, partial [Pluteus cervinus]